MKKIVGISIFIGLIIGSVFGYVTNNDWLFMLCFSLFSIGVLILIGLIANGYTDQNDFNY